MGGVSVLGILELFGGGVVGGGDKILDVIFLGFFLGDLVGRGMLEFLYIFRFTVVFI